MRMVSGTPPSPDPEKPRPFDLIDWDREFTQGRTLDEVDAELRAKGLDPGEFDHLYGSD